MKGAVRVDRPSARLTLVAVKIAVRCTDDFWVLRLHLPEDRRGQQSSTSLLGVPVVVLGRRWIWLVPLVDLGDLFPSRG